LDERVKMHADQLHVDASLVTRLVSEQFPEWRGRTISQVHGTGTVNAIFRIGRGLAARFPLTGDDPHAVGAQLAAEADAMRELAACSPVATPISVAAGRPGHGYPLPWAVQTWIPGAVATPTGLASSTTFAEDLAGLIRAFRAVDVRGRRFVGSGRGGDLADHDEWMQTCFRRSEGLLDVARLRTIWAQLRDLPGGGPDVMSHRDLIPANLLVRSGRLVGLLDGGDFGPADPSLDLVAAWHLLDADAREVLRGALGCGRTEWLRGMAWAFEQAMGLVWYYRETNPGMSAVGRSSLARILDDPSTSSIR
jgi:aminoglycoside phosphotransferase (APT) family kinase protein